MARISQTKQNIIQNPPFPASSKLHKKWGSAFIFMFILHIVQINALIDSSEHFIPVSKTPHFKTRVKRILLSAALGTAAGLAGAFLSVWFIRTVIGYLSQTPLLNGPLIFYPKIDPDSLKLALKTETHFPGSSFTSNGSCYRAVLANGVAMWVKNLKPVNRGTAEERRRMQRHAAVLGGLRHRNVMRLRAFVEELGRCCLVYEFVGNGCVEDVMKKVKVNQLELKWEVRLKIAVGIARGLQFLHFECKPSILHCNLKPENVILDAEFEPKLADCGLVNLMPGFDGPASLYTAPECVDDSSRYTDKSDIYSFGLILSLLLTGRDPNERPLTNRGDGSGSGRSLGLWLEQEQSAELREALDKSMRGEGLEDVEEMVLALRIAGVCASELPEDRPCSDELLVMLTQLQSF